MNFAEEEKRSRRVSVLYIIETFLFSLIIFCCIALVLWRVIGDPVIRVSGSSMYPTYRDGDLLSCTKNVEEGTLKRNDVVVFARKEESGKNLIKRVIGLPGERVRVTEEGVFINGELIYEPYDLPLPEHTADEVLLGEGEYFVLGDNRNNSRDSRSFGAVRIDEIKHKATGFSALNNTGIYKWIRNMGSTD